MLKKFIVEKGDDPVDMDSMGIVELDSTINCAYSKCRKQIPNNSQVYEIDTSNLCIPSPLLSPLIYCSQTCAIFDGMESGNMFSANCKTVRYKPASASDSPSQS